MADKTFGFKVTEDVYDGAKLVIDASGLSSKEWFENALAMYEVKSLQADAPEYTRNLSELELHTTRIYELVVNMVQQSIYFKDHAVREVTEQLTKKEALINELQEKLQTTKEQVNLLQKQSAEHAEQLVTSQEQIEEARKSNENNQLLIQEYKEKNDTLSGLVTKYQGYADENERLKAQFSEERAKLTETTSAQINELQQALNASTGDVKVLSEELARLVTKATEDQAKFEQDKALLEQRKDLETERTIVKIEREYQAKLQQQMDSYNDKVTHYQKENDRIRAYYEELLNEALNKK